MSHSTGEVTRFGSLSIAGVSGLKVLALDLAYGLQRFAALPPLKSHGERTRHALRVEFEARATQFAAANTFNETRPKSLLVGRRNGRTTPLLPSQLYTRRLAFIRQLPGETYLPASIRQRAVFGGICRE